MVCRPGAGGGLHLLALGSGTGKRDLMGLLTLKMMQRSCGTRRIKSSGFCGTIGEVFENGEPREETVTRSSRWKHY